MIGMRHALGASPRLMAMSVIRNCAVTAGLGFVTGVALAVAAGRPIEGLLIDVKGNDPITLAVVVVSLMALQLVAAVARARRAARIDPIVALRAD